MKGNEQKPLKYGMILAIISTILIALCLFFVTFQNQNAINTNSKRYKETDEEMTFTITVKDAESNATLPNSKFIIQQVSIVNGSYNYTDPLDRDGNILGESVTINGTNYRMFTTDSNGVISEKFAVGVYRIEEIETAKGYYVENSDKVKYFGVREEQTESVDIVINEPTFMGVTGTQTSEDYYVEGKEDGSAIYYVNGYILFIDSKSNIVNAFGNISKVYQIKSIDTGYIVLHDNFIDYYNNDGTENKVLLPTDAGASGMKAFDTDSNGNIVVTGTFDHDLIISSGYSANGQGRTITSYYYNVKKGLTIINEKRRAQNIFIIQLNSNYKVSNLNVIGGIGTDIPKSITVASDGNYVIAEYTIANTSSLRGDKEVDLGKFSDRVGNTSYAQSGIYNLIKVNSSNLSISKVVDVQTNTKSSVTSLHESLVHNIMTGKDGYLYYAGNTSNQITYTTVSGNSINLSPRDTDGLVVKYTNNLDVVWATLVGGTGVEHFSSSSITEDGGVIIGGDSLGGNITASGNETTSGLAISTKPQRNDIDLSWRGISAKIDTNGKMEWGMEFGFSTEEGCYAVTDFSNDTFALCGFEKSDSGSFDAVFIRVDEEIERETVTSSTELQINNWKKTYNIETETVGKGGSISRNDDSDIYEEVKYGETSTKNIKVSADWGYTIKSIVVQKTDEAGNTTQENIILEDKTKEYDLRAFTNVSTNIKVIAEFEIDTDVVFNIVLKDGDDLNVLLPDSKFTIQKATVVDGKLVYSDPLDRNGNVLGESTTIDGKNYRLFTTDEDGKIAESFATGIYRIEEIKPTNGYYVKEKDKIKSFGVGEDRGEEIELVLKEPEYVGVSGTNEPTEYYIEGKEDGSCLYYINGNLLFMDKDSNIIKSISSSKAYQIKNTDTGYIVLYDNSIVWYNNDGTQSKVVLSTDTGINGMRIFDIDNAGNIIVVGQFNGSITISSGYTSDGAEKRIQSNWYRNNLRAEGTDTHYTQDMYIIKIDSNSKISNIRNIGGISTDTPGSITVGKNGDYFITERTETINTGITYGTSVTKGTIDEVEVSGKYNLISVDSSTLRVKKIVDLKTNSRTNLYDSKDHAPLVNTVIQGNDGYLYYAGSTSETINYSLDETIGGVGSITVTPKGTDALVVKYTQDLKVAYAIAVGGNGCDHFYKADLSELGEMILSGDSDSGNIIVPGSETESGISISTTPERDDISLGWRGISVKVNSKGRVVWGLEFGYSSGEGCYAATTFHDDVFAICGFETDDAGNKNAVLMRVDEEVVSEAVTAVSEMEMYNYKKTYTIETSVSGEGGKISKNENDSIYEKVIFNDNATKEIKITPNKGYAIKSIVIQKTDDDGNTTSETLEIADKDKAKEYTISPFTNLNNDIKVTAEFEVDEEQTKEISYTVEYYKEGNIVSADTKIIKNTVQYLKPDTLTFDKSLINIEDKYVGYRLERTSPAVVPDTVNNGDVIKVHYVKKQYEYTVNHLEKDTNIVLHEPETFKESFENIVKSTDKKIEIDGYIFDSTDKDSIKISIESNENIINIYYVSNRINLTVTKIWDDNNNANEKRPDQIKISVKNGESKVKETTLTSSNATKDSNTWEYVFEDLTKYNDDKSLINYTIEENEVEQDDLKFYIQEIGSIVSENDKYGIPSSYSTSITNSFNVPNEKVDIIVNKIWADSNDANKKRPDSIKIVLSTAENKIEKAKKIENEEEIIPEENVVSQNIEKNLSENLVLNKENIEETIEDIDESVEEILEDTEKDAEEIIEEQDTEEVVEEVANENDIEVHGMDAVEENSWIYILKVSEGENSYTYKDLPRYDERGNEIVYVVDEEEVTEGDLFFYTKEIKETSKNNFTIVNSFIVPDDKIEISVEKIWVDNEEQAKKRPESVTVKVINGTEILQEKIVNKESDWKTTFDNLAKYDNTGNIIEYTVSESETNENDLKFYKNTEITGNNDEGFKIVNTFTKPADTINIVVTSQWEDDSNKYEKRPENLDLTITGKNDKNEELAEYDTNSEIDKSDSDIWKYTFTVPTYDDDGKEINYVVNPKSISGYSQDIDKYNVTNTFFVKDLQVSKVGPETISSIDEEVEYTITYNLELNDSYVSEDELQIKVVDTLPYKINEEYEFNYDGGVYNYNSDEDIATITWTGLYNIKDKTISWIDPEKTDDDRIVSVSENITSPIEFSKTISFVYQDIPSEGDNMMINKTIGSIESADGVKIEEEATSTLSAEFEKDFTVNVIWKGDLEKDSGKVSSVRPDSLDVNLKAIVKEEMENEDGSKYEIDVEYELPETINSKVTLTNEDENSTEEKWTYIWNNLPKYNSERKEIYYLAELNSPLEEYYTDIDEKEKNVITIVNYKYGSITATKIDDKKIDEEGNTLKLGGAEYTIEKLIIDENGEKIVDNSFTSESKETTNDLGTASFNHLKYGTYRLTEIKAPDGYKLLRDAIEVEITEENPDVSIEIIGREKSILPETGGDGTILLMIAGSLLIIVTICIEKYRRQKNKK